MLTLEASSSLQAAGLATANERSAKRVLVRRTTKLPRADDRRRVTAATANIDQIRRRCAVKYIKHEDAQLVRYASAVATGSQCNRRSSGVAWLRAGSEQTRRAAQFWIRWNRWRTDTLQLANSPLQ